MLTEIFKSVVALVASFSMLFTPITPSLVHEETTQDTIHYVALGGSNTVGFGLDSFIPDEVKDNPVLVADSKAAFIGYQNIAEDAYPSLIAKALSDEDTTVELDQLGMCSMRAEELRMILDETYEGDSYTAWRFTGGENAFAVAANIIDSAAMAAEPTMSNAIAILRAEYQSKIAAADIITLDIGVNNFSVYVSNRLFNDMYDGSDMEHALSDLDYFVYSEIYDDVVNLVEKYFDVDLDSDTFDEIVDTFAYAMYGYVTSFDAVVEKIYEINPNANIVVVSIQNLMDGLTLDVNDVSVPLGDIYGAIINMANLYTATLSPYADTYNYALLAEDGHIDTFLDELQRYDGTVAGVSENFKNCVNIYDNNLFAGYRVKYEFVKALDKQGAVVTSASSAIATIDYILSDVEVFAKAYAADLIVINDVPARTLFTQAEEDVKKVEVLVLQPQFEVYLKALDNVYAGLAKAFKDATASGTISLNGLTAKNISDIEDGLLDTVADYITECASSGFAGQSIPEFELPDTAKNDAVRTVMLMGIRNSIGNSFFVHPSEEGHKQVAAAILNAYNTGVTGKDIALYKMSENAADKLEEHVAEYKDDANNAVKEVAEAVADEVKDTVNNVAEAIADEDKNTINAITDETAGKITDAIDAAADAIAADAPLAIIENAIEKAAEDLNDGVDTFFDSLADSAAENIDKTVELINDSVANVADTAVKAVEDAVAGVIDTIGADHDELGVKIDETLDTAAEVPADVAGKVAQSAVEVAENVAKAVDEAPALAADAINDAVNNAVDAVIGIDAETVVERATNIAGYIGEAAGKLSGIFSRLGK